MDRPSLVALIAGTVLGIAGACSSTRAISPSDTQGIDRDTYLKMVAPDLSLVQVAEPSFVRPGETVNITLTVSNKRPASAPKVLVSDVLPSTLTFVSCAATETGVCRGTNGDRTVSFDALAGGASARVTIVATINRNVADGTRVTNVASVGFDGSDPNPSDNSASAFVTVSPPR